jgi:polar amino acid transport system substrate-binding protein
MSGRRSVYRACFALALILLTGLLTGCIPPEEDPLAPRDHPRDTPMGRIQEAGVLVAGVEPRAPWGQIDPENGAMQGFVVELAQAVADALEVELEVISADAEELLEMVEDGRADIAFPLVEITERAARNNAFTNPYWVGHQKLLVSRGAGISSPEDLDGGRVCQFIHELAGVDLTDLNPAAEVQDADLAEDCLAPLAEGVADAVTAFDVFLVHLMARTEDFEASRDDFEIAGEQMATAGYGAVVEWGVPSYVRFVNLVFGATKADRRWHHAYEQWLEPYLRTPPNPPFLTVDEAATLHPIDL